QLKMNKFKFLPIDKISGLPKSPGVYTFNRGAKLLYIGKAANIKERVKNHFQQPHSLWEQTLLRPRLRQGFGGQEGFGGRVGFIKTNSEIEALILEANLIKKYQPKYNVIWRDDKNYFFVGITKENFPQVFITHQTKVKGQNSKVKSDYIGPFVDGASLKATLKILRKIFLYISCKNLPKRPCLWYHLNRCPAPCLLKSKTAQQIPMLESKIKQESQKNTKNLIKILQGKKTKVLKDFKKEMKKAALFQDFDKAAKIRDQIQALERVLANAKIFELQPFQAINWSQTQKTLQKILKTKHRISRIEAYDVSNIQGQEATGAMITFINGKPEKSQYRKFKIRIAGKPNDTAMIKEVLKRRLKHQEWSYPNLILIDGGKAQLNAALQCLKHKFKEIKLMALAKKHNELFIERRKQSILLKKLPREIFNLILQLRDEAHRFAISYHHKLREIDLRESLC
ncbi:UvrB/UvrC motif-containing protein, partial [Patescibacteria group bacterium]|nr:UvrB/UvrC motif-containing protein [Patescibacteria group bacterium]